MIFPDTSLGLVSRLVEATGAEREDSLQELCRRYWQPVYCAFRLGRAKSVEDAHDLTQSFFLWLLDHDALRRYARERGKFRTFLRAVLTSFLIKEERDAHRLKRGGWSTPLPLEEGERPLREILADPRSQDPERAYDLAWAITLTRKAIDRVRQRWQPEAFRIFEEYDLAGASASYADVAGKLGVTESVVRNQLSAIRAEIRREIRLELVNITSSVQELEEEWNALFGA